MTRARLGLIAALYAVVVVYASTVIGPAGPHFVPIDPHEALSRLLKVSWEAHGSDQRSDWMGNVMMLVPMGFLLAGSLAPRRRFAMAGRIAAFGLCVAFVLAVKYAQIFFPPRTVTLNYIVAQSFGAAIGIVLFAVLRAPLAALGQGTTRMENLRTLLRIYTGLLCIFLLMPLDFALSADDLAVQLARLPGSLTMLSGEDRPLTVRLALIAASVVYSMPIGALLTLAGGTRVYVGRSTGAAIWTGFCLMMAIYGLTALVIGATASLPAVGFRTLGIGLGAWSMQWLSHQSPHRLRVRLGAIVPWAAPPYLLAVLAMNGLLSWDWIGPDAAARDFYDLGLIPLFNYYIVTKGQAAKNIVAHAVMYAPIGVMIWLRVRHGTGRALSFWLAATLSGAVEFGRFLRPGLVPDINAVPLAGIAAWTAASFMPAVWRMADAVAAGVAGPIQPRVPRDPIEPDPAPPEPGIGETGEGGVENY